MRTMVLVLAAACGGAEPADECVDCDPTDPPVEPPTDPPPADADGDGFVALADGGDDCDDTRADVHPEALEIEAWEVETIGAAMSWSTPWLALDADGAPRVAFTTEAAPGSYDVRVASRGDDGWIAALVVAGGDTGAGPLAIDADGVGHLCRVRTSPSLAVDYWTDAEGAWTRETLIDGALSCSLAVADDGVVHAVTSGGTGLSHLWRTDAGWSLEPIASITDAYTDLAQAPDGSFAAAYKRHSRDELGLASSASGGWELEAIEAVQTGALVVPSIAVEPSGAVHVGSDDGNGVVLHAVDEGDGFAVEVVGAGEDASFAWDEVAGGRFVFGRQGSGLMYAMPSATGQGWTASVLDPAADGAHGTAVAIGGGVVHVVYPTYAPSLDGTLLYARRSIEDGVDQDCDGIGL